RETHAARELVCRIAGQLDELSFRDGMVDVGGSPIEGETMVHREVPHLLHARLRAAQLVREPRPTLSLSGCNAGRAHDGDGGTAQAHRMSHSIVLMSVAHAVFKSRGDASVRATGRGTAPPPPAPDSDARVSARQPTRES